MSMRYPDVTAHRLVAQTAVEMAQEIYEELCSGSNAIYKVHGDRDDFIRQCAPTLRAAARAVLAEMLTKPEHEVSQWEKDKIYEALVMDAELPTTGTSVVKKKDYM